MGCRVPGRENTYYPLESGPPRHTPGGKPIGNRLQVDNLPHFKTPVTGVAEIFFPLLSMA